MFQHKPGAPWACLPVVQHTRIADRSHMAPRSAHLCSTNHAMVCFVKSSFQHLSCWHASGSQLCFAQTSPAVAWTLWGPQYQGGKRGTVSAYASCTWRSVNPSKHLRNIASKASRWWSILCRDPSAAVSVNQDQSCWMEGFTHIQYSGLRWLSQLHLCATAQSAGPATLVFWTDSRISPGNIPGKTCASKGKLPVCNGWVVPLRHITMQCINCCQHGTAITAEWYSNHCNMIQQIQLIYNAGGQCRSYRSRGWFHRVTDIWQTSGCMGD